MIRVSAKKVREIIENHLWCFNNKQIPEYILVSKKHDLTDAKGCLIGPIDGEYGLCVNVRDYIFDTEEALAGVVLHEMVHFNLLIEGNHQHEEHSDIFNDLAREIAKKSGNQFIVSDENCKIDFFVRYRKKYFNVLLFKKDGNNYLTTIPTQRLRYWKKYMKEGVEIGQFDEYIFQRSNKCIFEQLPLSDKDDLICCIFDDEDYGLLSKE